MDLIKNFSASLIWRSTVQLRRATWRHLVSVPCASLTRVTYFPFRCSLLPESPRWLLAQKRYDDASRALNRIAAINGRQLPPEFDVRSITVVSGIKSRIAKKTFCPCHQILYTNGNIPLNVPATSMFRISFHFEGLSGLCQVLFPCGCIHKGGG